MEVGHGGAPRLASIGLAVHREGGGARPPCRSWSACRPSAAQLPSAGADAIVRRDRDCQSGKHGFVGGTSA